MKKYVVSKGMIDAATAVLPVALEKLTITTGDSRAVPRAAVRRAILHPEKEPLPVVALPPGDAPLVILSGHAALLAAYCRGETHCACRVVPIPRPRLPGKAVWCPQEEENGCGVAALAAVTGKSYAAVRRHYGRDFTARGLTDGEIDDFLAAEGLAADRRTRGTHAGAWPPAPWGRVHLCVVAQKDRPRPWHVVTMLADGTVLDPGAAGARTLADYGEVVWVAAVVPQPLETEADK